MSCYRNYTSSDTSWWSIIVSFILIIAMIFGFNACTASTWNNGICPNCNVRYELRGVSRGIKYYICSECGQEVSRWIGGN